MMLSKNRLGTAPKIYFRPEINSCPHCETKLRRSHTAWKKKIDLLNDTIYAWSMAYACPNQDCPHPGVAYKSAEAEARSMKHSSYGYHVLGLVGELRFKQHRTCKEIADALTARGIPTSERYAQSLYERYQTLLAASLDDHIRNVLAETTVQNGGIILSMDGVQPEKGNEMLYVIREVFSGTVLVARNMKSGTAAELQTLIEPIIALGLPIVGIISDGQSSIRLAFASLLPDVPYQYCQFYYLKDIAKPVVDADRKLKMELKKSMRGIRDIERKIEQTEAKAAARTDSGQTETKDTAVTEARIAKGYMAAVRSLLLEDGEPPLELPGMIIYERAQAIQTSLQRCLDKKGAQPASKRFPNFQ
ncbi:transposase [Paenibacillus cymbidii]|uniref:transposase n=1 Tax=Paenibacillus cymbidii TaxID=1639034 RepID=UPI001080D932|nr:transposase [Paenibacillus cymbidii]